MKDPRRTMQFNSVQRIYSSEGSLARKDMVYRPALRTRSGQRLQRTERQKQVAAKVARQKKAIAYAAAVFAAAVLVALLVVMLTLNVSNNNLRSDIAGLESRVEELRSQNDSKEYDMNSSVDLNYVVQVATQEMGMVRSNAGQIRTYSSSDAEYLKQLAGVPKD